MTATLTKSAARRNVNPQRDIAAPMEAKPPTKAALRRRVRPRAVGEHVDDEAQDALLRELGAGVVLDEDARAPRPGHPEARRRRGAERDDDRLQGGGRYWRAPAYLNDYRTCLRPCCQRVVVKRS